VRSIFVGAVVVLSISASGAAQTHRRSIVHERDLPPYSPPAHSDTVNRRLVGGDFAGTFELIHGTIAPGGEAEPHQRERESQVIYILSGQAQVTLGTDKPERCQSGDVVKIPPGLRHHVVNTGSVPLELMIVYSPPLPASGALQR
jgi:mannose-6-phosphate isomerase-like protein (cupin superfamily)